MKKVLLFLSAICFAVVLPVSQAKAQFPGSEAIVIRCEQKFKGYGKKSSRVVKEAKRLGLNPNTCQFAGVSTYFRKDDQQNVTASGLTQIFYTPTAIPKSGIIFQGTQAQLLTAPQTVYSLYGEDGHEGTLSLDWLIGASTYYRVDRTEQLSSGYCSTTYSAVSFVSSPGLRTYTITQDWVCNAG